MITKRIWKTRRSYRSRNGIPGKLDNYDVTREGWFLLGVIPLYMRDVAVSIS